MKNFMAVESHNNTRTPVAQTGGDEVFENSSRPVEYCDSGDKFEWGYHSGRNLAEKYRVMLDSMHEPAYICTADLKIVYMNPSMISRSRQDGTGEYCFQAVHDQESKCPWCVIEKIQQGEYCETEMVSPKDERFYHVAHCPLFQSDGSIAKLTIMRDVTHRAQMEAQLRESEQRYRIAVEHSSDGIAIHRYSKHLYVNKKYVEMFGYDGPEEILGKSVYLTVHPEDLKKVMEINRLWENGDPAPTRYEFKGLRKDGRIIHAEASVAQTNYRTQSVLQTYLRDISERKQSIEALRNAHSEIEYLVSSLPTILIGLSPDYCVTRWNGMAVKVFGIEASAMIGQSIQESAIQWDWAKIQQGVSECCRKCDSVRIDDIVFERLNGKDGFLGITVNPVTDDSKRIMGFTIIGADITERKALENQLTQSQKLKSIGQLAAGIAHEINTPTQYVGDNTRFVEESFFDLKNVFAQYAKLLAAAKTDSVNAELIEAVDASLEDADLEYLMDEIPTAIQQTLEGIDRISKIVRAMKEFSHPGREEKTSIDINNALESTITVARNEWKYVAEMKTDFDPSLPLVSCLPGEINQVFLNLIINAAHAIGDIIDVDSGEKGTIEITTRSRDDWVEIAVSDTGTGIPDAIKDKIFDPFFTTKEVGRGTGQGLAICFPVIVEKHGGKIHLNTEVDKGTTFIISLPVAI